MTRLRFGLRTLLFLCILAAVAFGFLGRLVHKARFQHDLAERFRGLGCRVVYDFNILIRGPDGHWTEDQPHLLAEYLGVDLFHDVIAIEESGQCRATDDDLKWIREFPRLRGAILAGDLISNSGLDYLRDISGLEELILWDTLVTAEGVAKLKKHLPRCDVLRGSRCGKVVGVCDHRREITLFDVVVYDDNTIHRVNNENYVIETKQKNEEAQRVWSMPLGQDAKRAIQDALGRIDWKSLLDMYEDPNVWDGCEIFFHFVIDDKEWRANLRNVRHQGLMDLTLVLNSVASADNPISYPRWGDDLDWDRDDRITDSE